MIRRSGLLLALVLAACAGEADRDVVRVAAAASLTDVLPEILERYETDHDVRVELRFGASSMLARQILEGAETDAIVSADPRWIDALAARELARGEDRAIVATNRLVAIVPIGAIGDPPRDLGALVALPRLALAAPEVPAGAHARTALERGGVLGDATPRIVEAADVRGALAWVAAGETEAGIVYATDARAEPRVRVAFELDPESHEPIRYEAAALARDPGGETSAHGRAIVAMLRSAAAQRALAGAGFGPPP